MNKLQRNKRLLDAERLRRAAKAKTFGSSLCSNCGEPGAHWVSTSNQTGIGFIVTGNADFNGFWTCSKYYDKETGRRVGH